MKVDAEASVEPDLLKERIFVASLIRVLTDVFGSAKDLYHRLKQQSTYDDEDEKAENDKHDKDRRDSHSNILESLNRHVRWSLDQRARHYSDREDELVCNASAQVQTTYDRAYHKLGESYARGDDIARVQLQSQIIKLQQVLINIHQDFGLSNYLTIASSHSQLIHLVQTIRTTRAAALQSLDLLHQRLLAMPPSKPRVTRPQMPGGFPTPKKPRSRSNSSSSSSSKSSAPPIPAPLKPTPKPAPYLHHHPNPNLAKLFCPFALSLQRNPSLPLPIFTSAPLTCSYCHTRIPVRPNKAWEIIMTARGRHPRYVKYLVRNEFVVKCHRVGGGFACVLCTRWRTADTVCADVEGLMEHLWREHRGWELERDGDVVRG